MEGDRVIDCNVAIGGLRDEVRDSIILNHYAHSVPSGKSHYLLHGDVVAVFSIPGNRNIAGFLLGQDAPPVWELSRLWAPDDHAPNALTMAISAAVRTFKALEPAVAALVSYADPNVGHIGGIYRAASWAYCGQCEEGRYYEDGKGQVVARRKFHSGKRGMRKAEIEAMGYTETKKPGKHRYARGLTRWARARLRKKFPELALPSSI
jgi:hypothetical protein